MGFVCKVVIFLDSNRSPVVPKFFSLASDQVRRATNAVPAACVRTGSDRIVTRTRLGFCPCPPSRAPCPAASAATQRGVVHKSSPRPQPGPARADATVGHRLRRDIKVGRGARLIRLLRALRPIPPCPGFPKPTLRRRVVVKLETELLFLPSQEFHILVDQRRTLGLWPCRGGAASSPVHADSPASTGRILSELCM